jgi:PilZ domain
MTMPSKPEFRSLLPTIGKASSRQELRCAVRFPVELPVLLTTEHGDVPAVTRNVSASGVLLELDERLLPGAEIRFSLRMPHSVLGTPQDVLVYCAGRVIRCSLSQKLYLAAATIDDYRFAEH